MYDVLLLSADASAATAMGPSLAAKRAWEIAGDLKRHGAAADPVAEETWPAPEQIVLASHYYAAFPDEMLAMIREALTFHIRAIVPTIGSPSRSLSPWVRRPSGVRLADIWRVACG